MMVQCAPAARVPQLLLCKNPALAWMLLTLSGELPWFVKVTGLAVLVVLIFWSPNATNDGERLATGARTPVPLSGNACGLPGALLVIVSMPVRMPAAVGVKVTFMKQLLNPPGEIELQKGLREAAEKSPLATALDKLKLPLPMLFTVKETTLLIPTVVFPTAPLRGPPFVLNCKTGLVPFVPEPNKETVCGLSKASSVIVSVPLRVPAAVGLKVTLSWQELLGETGLLHMFATE
jgi:hypothetical protein